MINGIGTDIVSVKRIEKSLQKKEFETLVFTPFESSYCRGEGSGIQSFAGRFAAKEALFKALGTGWAGDLKFNEVEVFNDELGKPLFRFRGETLAAMEAMLPCAIHLSISHTAEFATAYVVIESGDSRNIED